MTKYIVAALAVAFAATSLTMPAAAAKMKSAPGKCGTYMFYSMKKHKCMDKRS